jgi:two-component system LytT family response regulator
MLKVVIIEGEQIDIENLLFELNNLSIEYDIAAILKSVEESISWFNNRITDIDLIFMNTHLRDGLSFDIFQSVNIKTPVIFTTCYEKYLQTSLEYNGIDYLLKPISNHKLRQSITKFNNLKTHFTANYQFTSNHNGLADNTNLKDRIIVKKGIEFQSIKVEEVAYFYTEHKLVFLVDKEGKKYLAHASNLTDLMAQLNKKVFFRANRKYIININFIKKYKHFDRVKVEVELSMHSPDSVVISQENSSSFKNWIENL